MKKLKVCVAIIAAIGLSASSVAQALSKQEAPPRPRQTKQPQKPGPEPLEKPVSTTPIQEPEAAMRRAITELSTQIGLLTGEIRKLRRETERNSGAMELLLTEDRLSKLEDKIQEIADRKAQLDAREQEINRRTRNIPNELMLRGGLRRDEAEAAIRGELQRSLDDVHSQQAIAQQRLVELNEQAARFRARVETLRKKLEIPEEKGVKEEK
jgi:predicted  nucleic acid-binding Zn-ribbon protein